MHGGDRRECSQRGRREELLRDHNLGRADAHGRRECDARRFHTHPSGRHARGAGGHREHSQHGRREELLRDHSLGRAGGCGSRELHGS